MAILNVGGSRKKGFTQKEIEKMLKKTARGLTTDIAKYAEIRLKYNTKKLLYGQNLVDTKKHYYKASGEFYRAITREPTELLDDEYTSEVGWSDQALRESSTDPVFRRTRTGKLKLVEFGRYTDVNGDYVGDEMVEAYWLEEGTNKPSIVKRRGAYMVETTMEDINNFIMSHNLDSSISKEFGNVIVSVSRGR